MLNRRRGSAVGPIMLSVGIVVSTVALVFATPSVATASNSNPIKIMAILDLTGVGGANNSVLNTYKASVDAINAKGGVLGRPLDLLVCDSAVNPNNSAACGREAAADKVAAVATLAVSAGYEPYLLAAHIPALDGMLDPVMYKSPISFSVWGGGVTSGSAVPVVSHHLGCKKTAEVNASGTSPAELTAIEANFNSTLHRFGEQAGPYISPPLTAPDMAPYIADAEQPGVDCLDLEGEGSTEVSLLNAAFTTGSPSVKIITAEFWLSPQTVSSLGSEVNKISLVFDQAAQATGNTPLTKQWVADVKKYSAQPQTFAAVGCVSWDEIRAIATAIKGADSASSAKVLSYLDHMSHYDAACTPPVNFTKAPTNPFGPRVFDAYVLGVKYKNGNFYATTPFLSDITGKPYAG